MHNTLHTKDCDDCKKMGPDVVTVNEIPQTGKVHWHKQTITALPDNT